MEVIGNQFCQVVDERGIGAYLETDAEANVRLYQRFGFDVVGTTEIYDGPNYFMWREPRV